MAAAMPVEDLLEARAMLYEELVSGGTEYSQTEFRVDNRGSRCRRDQIHGAGWRGLRCRGCAIESTMGEHEHFRESSRFVLEMGAEQEHMAPRIKNVHT